MAEYDIFLQLRDLRTKFGPTGKNYPVVKGINLNIERGKVLGLVGESGCGESVIMFSSTGPLPKNNCEATDNIFFDGQELNRLPDKEFQKIHGKRISAVFQEPMTSLNSIFTVSQQLSGMLEQHLGMTGQANKTKCLELLNLVSIPNPVSVYDHYPSKLSGDMRRRVVIAMALAYDPGLVIAGKPTTALDVTTQARITDLFKELQKKLNTTIIFISHDLEVIGEINNSIAVLYVDYVMEECDIKTLFHDPLHPYTFGLMNSRMGRSLKNKGKLYNIPGVVPSVESMPTGYPFAPCYPKVGGQCTCGIPPLVEIEPGHEICCWEVTNYVEVTDWSWKSEKIFPSGKEPF